MKTEINKKFLLVQEVEMHPASLLDKLRVKFEAPDVIQVNSKTSLRSYVKPPIFDSNYLVVFTSVRLLEENLPFLKLEFMLPIIMCSNRNMLEEAKRLLIKKQFSFSVYVNKFQKEDAIAFIYSLAATEVSNTFCETLVRRVGLSPRRIISAMLVCEQVGYSADNIAKYVDKYVYIDIYDVIYSLLFVSKSNAQRKRASLYLHRNRFWYNTYTRQLLLDELTSIEKVYCDIVTGVLTPMTHDEYLHENQLSNYRLNYAIELYDIVSLNAVQELKQFIQLSTLLEVAMRLN